MEKLILIIQLKSRLPHILFTLENIRVRTGSDGLADPQEWVSASYVRKGSVGSNASNKTRDSITTPGPLAVEVLAASLVVQYFWI